MDNLVGTHLQHAVNLEMDVHCILLCAGGRQSGRRKANQTVTDPESLWLACENEC